MINMINIRVCKINFNVWILLTIFIIININHQTLMLCIRNVFKKVVEKQSLFDLRTFTYNPAATNFIIPIYTYPKSMVLQTAFGRKVVYMHTGFWVTIATFEMNTGWFLSPYSINPSREHVTTALSCCDYTVIECPQRV